LTPLGTPSSRPSTPANHILTAKGGPGGKVSRRARKAAQTPTYVSSGDESHKKSRSAKSTAKKGRKWDADGLADEDSDTPLDYSAPANGATSGEDEGRPGAVDEVEQTSWGSKTGKGQFVLKDLDDEVHSILSSANAKKAESATTSTGLVGSSISAIGGLFRNVVGGKTLTKEDLDKAMKGMEDHLLRKNVAREAAMRLCEGVERELIGVKTGSFESMFISSPALLYIANSSKVYKQRSKQPWSPHSGRYSHPPLPSICFEKSTQSLHLPHYH
jgi:signal recognition particle receptor subunit alpha